VVRNKKFEFDLSLGMKFVYFKVGLTTDLGGELPLSGEISNFWVDPVIATNLATVLLNGSNWWAMAMWGPPLLIPS
jgi:hypothetical protein